MSKTIIPTIAIKILPPEPLKVLLILKTLMTYTHNRPEFEFNGNTYKLRFGELVTTYDVLVSQLNMERSKVESIIQLFHTMTLIEVIPNPNLLIRYNEHNVEKLEPRHTQKIINQLNKETENVNLEIYDSLIQKHRKLTCRLISRRERTQTYKHIEQALSDGYTIEQMEQFIELVRTLGSQFYNVEYFFENIEIVFQIEERRKKYENR